ncbi:MAG: SGNH/GDSL hydrolase family protein [Pseudomonadota bacterium]
MTAFRKWLAAVLLVCCQSSWGFSQLVIFGDSLSDTGNLTGVFPLPPPYYSGRVSNGPVAVDYFAESLGLTAISSGHVVGNLNGQNYAIAGGNASGSDIEDLRRQVDVFLARHPTGLGSNTLYVVFIGGNDVRDARDTADAGQQSALISSAVGAIRSTIIRLRNAGAAYVLVVNVPDIGEIPETLRQTSSNPAIRIRATASSVEFNQELSQMLDGFDSGQLQLYEFDLFKTMNRIIANPAAFGLTNIDQPCFDTDRFVTTPGCDFDQYLFFDNLHPTSRGHELIASGMIRALRPTAFLPGVILLLE